VSVTFLADGAAPPRVAYAVGRRVGGAADRNRLRRRLRAIVGEAAPGLAPGAYLVAAGPDAAALPHPQLQALVSDALEAVSR
jgi:ribonuclease P protein component